jgi:SAM-dependent methyltransferase
MQPERDSLVKAYDRDYLRADYFGYREWLYRPYIKALARRARLEPGCSILDAGCGQGFFTQVFVDLGFSALGADMSIEGIRAAKRQYGSTRARYIVGDVRNLGFRSEFDCVFTRSCSLYNREALGELTAVTDKLLEYVRPGGVLIFDYYTRLSPRRKSSSWIYHSLRAVRSHFSQYPRSEVFFSLRADSLIFGSLTFSRPVSAIDATLSRWCGVGGELVAIVRK